MSEPENTSTISGTTNGVRRIFTKIPSDLIPLLVLFVTVFLVILYAYDWKLWDGMNAVETTNDAYIRSDVTPLSTKVSGTVAEVLIDDYQAVKKGQLLFRLRDDDYRARVERTKAQCDRALATIKTIEHQLAVQDSKIQGAGYLQSASVQDVDRQSATAESESALVSAAESAREEAQAQKVQAQEKLNADEALLLRASQEKARQEELFNDDAATRQTVEQVVADHDRARALVAADKAEILRLDRLVDQRKHEVKRQREQFAAARASTAQSRYALDSKKSALLTEQREKLVLSAQLQQAKADLESAQAAYREALVELDYTKIYAPVDGTLSERRVRAGQEVNAGTQVITIVSAIPWVIANYRETQMRHIAVGDKASVSVDALGGATLQGHVQSLSPASEAQFALLPPDNPSGNFTKITQRIPIKIVFEKDQNSINRIKPGMTVITKVWTNRR
ncbi:MAG: HlyD family secretion protein [Candidatus Melainabacteria bacterium]|nr:HlyD family secretion protein [Candidatus Melainabacteria bacterium]